MVLIKIKYKIIISFITMLLLSMSSYIILANTEVNRLFEHYAKIQCENKIQEIRRQVEQSYQPDQDTFNVEILQVIGNSALQSGIILKLEAANKSIDWDVSTHRERECEMILAELKQTMQSKYPLFRGDYEERTVDVTYEGKRIGILTLGQYGPYTFDKIELQLITRLDQIIGGLGVTFILIAFLLGSYISLSLTRNIKQVVMATKTITEGNYGIHIKKRSNILEIIELINSINILSDTLEDKEKQKKQITSDIAHELRTPLCNLQSHMEAVIDGVWEPSLEMYQNYHEEIVRLTKLVNQLEQLSAYEDHSIQISCDWFLAREFLEKVYHLFICSALEKGIELEIIKVKEELHVYADEEKLLQCMINLVSNAIRYTEHGGKIIISSIQVEDKIQFIVEDTGIGLSQNQRSQVFERFYRVDPSRNQNTGGRGIGLAITKAIIDMHGGQVMVSSRIGKGTKFIIQIPV